MNGFVGIVSFKDQSTGKKVKIKIDKNKKKVTVDGDRSNNYMCKDIDGNLYLDVESIAKLAGVSDTIQTFKYNGNKIIHY